MFKDTTPDLLRPIKSDDFLPDISNWTTLGGLLLASTIGVAILISSLIKYNVTIKAIATVRPLGEIRTVQAGQQGIIKNIKVKVNQLVLRGDEIALLEDSSLQTQRSQLIGNIQQNKLQLERSAFELKALQEQIAAESQSTQEEVESATAELKRNQRDYQERQVTTSLEVKEAEASLELARSEMEQYEQLKDTGALSELQIQQKEQAYKVALSRLQKAKAGLYPSSANITIARARITQQIAKGKSTLAILEREHQELMRRKVEIQNQINSDEKTLKQVLVDMEKSIIRASESGTILKLELRNIGQIVHTGDVIAQIVPKSSALVVKARVAPQDIGKVQVCQELKVTKCQKGRVQMRISAYPYPDYGTLAGAVRFISADVISPSNSSMPYYEITIQPDRLYLKRGEHHYPIQPGMDITADIISKEETFLNFFLRKARLITDL